MFPYQPLLGCCRAKGLFCINFVQCAERFGWSLSPIQLGRALIWLAKPFSPLTRLPGLTAARSCCPQMDFFKCFFPNCCHWLSWREPCFLGQRFCVSCLYLPASPCKLCAWRDCFGWRHSTIHMWVCTTFRTLLLSQSSWFSRLGLKQAADLHI